jgi:hypothetical protein
MGKICPAGYYCPQGTLAEVACAAGTYQPLEGAAAIGECLSCPPGKYCNIAAASAPSGSCTAGYFCTSGETNPSPAANICNIGYTCPTGSSQQIKCDVGSFSANTQSGATTCPVCNVGKYCFESSTEVDCNIGYFCPGSDKKKACVPGKIGIAAAKSVVGDACGNCPTKNACPFFGTTAATVCTAGYYCAASSISVIPKLGATEGGGRCLRGYYCPAGSDAMIPCPGGKYCANEGLAEASGSCEAGYYCKTKATVKNAEADGVDDNKICPVGYYCPEGTQDPL